MAVASLVLILVGLVIVIAGELGRRGLLRRNAYVGIRLPITLSSDEAWNAAHRAAGSWLVAGGGACVIGGAATGALDADGGVAALVLTLAVVLTAVGTATAVGVRAAGKISA